MNKEWVYKNKIILSIIGFIVFLVIIAPFVPKDKTSGENKSGNSMVESISKTSTPSKSPVITKKPTSTPRKITFELMKPYLDGDEKWQTIIVPIDSTIEELTNLAKDIHKNNPEIYYNIFDNKDEVLAYQKWAISRNDPSVYFPEKWVNEHSVGFINKMLTTRGLIWQLYPTPSDFWGNSVPEGIDLE